MALDKALQMIGPFNPVASILGTLGMGIGSLFGGSKAVPLTPEEKVVQGLEYLANQQNELRTSGPDQDMQEGSMEALSGNEETLKSLINEGMALGMTPAQLNPAISNVIGSVPTLFAPPQETSALMDLVREAGGKVVEGTADLGNLVTQAVTLGQGPKLEAVIPNILDIIRGNIGGTLVFGGGQTPVPVLGTGQTGIGAGTKVGLPSIPVIGPVINQGVSIIQQGGTLADVMRSIPDSLINNVPEVLSGVAAAGLLFDEKDKDTLVNLGVDPVIIKTEDDKTGGGADTDTIAGGTDTDMIAGGGDSAVVKTGGVGIPDPEAPKIGGVGIPEPEVVKAGLTPIDDPFKGEKTSVVKTGEEVKTSTPASEGVGGVGGLPAGGGGTGTISGGPGPLVDIDYLYDMAGSLAQPFLSTEDEDEEDLKVYAKGGGHVKKFSNGTLIQKDSSGFTLNPNSALGGGSGSNTQAGGKFSFRDFIDQNAKTIAGGLVGGLLGISDDSGGSGPVGYQGGIPDYKFNRTLKDDAFSTVNPDGTPRRPGSMGRSYFDYGDELFTGTGTMQGVGLPSLVETDTTVTPTTGLPAGLTYTPVTDVNNAESALGAAEAAAAAASVDTAGGADTAGGDGINVNFGGTAEQFNTGVATGPVQQPSAYDLLMAGAKPSSDNIGTVVDAIKSGEASIPQVAGKFGVGTLDVAEDLLRNRGFTPADVVGYMNKEGLTEEELIVRLLDAGKTTPEEVAAYYGETADEIRNTFNTKYDYTTRELAQGGPLNNYYLGGPTDGMADLIPASIDGTQPAALSDGEFVIPADVVSHLGNGNSDAGANQLMSMMDRVRNARTGTTKQGTEIDPMKMMPA